MKYLESSPKPILGFIYSMAIGMMLYPLLTHYKTYKS